jgi:DNA-binding PucR family transcriptional regulator
VPRCASWSPTRWSVRASRSASSCARASASGGVTAAEEVHGRALLADVEAFVAGWSATVSPQLRALSDHDRHHGTEYVLTLRAVLDALGNAAQAARALHVHVNTVRYRMRRVSELTGIDLGDGDARLALELELRARGGGAG